DQAAQDAAASCARRVRTDAAGGAVRTIHLFGGLAAADAAQGFYRGSLGAHLDEPAAGARLGLSPRLTFRTRCWSAGFSLCAIVPSNRRSHAAAQNSDHPGLAARRLAQC